MSMSRKDFEAIAKAIDTASDCDDRDDLLAVLFMELDSHFRLSNPNYNSSRFAKACGF